MVDADFVPFVAPRVGKRPPPHSSEPSPVVDAPDPESARCVAASQAVSIHLADEAPQPEPSLLEQTCMASDANPLGAQGDGGMRGESRVCDHGVALRNEAIRLAAIACGRALRHALVLHPGVIAAFVDDALAAAGKPRHARIRVHPDCLENISADHDCVGDGDLEMGDVVVEFDTVSLGADLLERSKLLVSAADA